MDRKATISLLRQLYRELRPTLSLGQKHVYDCSHWKYIASVSKKEHTSTLSPDQLKHLGHLGQKYLTYLKSTREYLEIMERYKGKGERSAMDTAHLVGLRMPHEARQPRKCSKSQDQSSSSSGLQPS